jgi:hypothetical protein
LECSEYDERFSINAGIFKNLNKTGIKCQMKGIEKFNQGSLWHKKGVRIHWLKFDYIVNITFIENVLELF